MTLSIVRVWQKKGLYLRNYWKLTLLLGHYDGQVKLPCFDTHFPCDPKKDPVQLWCRFSSEKWESQVTGARTACQKMGSILTSQLERIPQKEHTFNANRTILCLRLLGCKPWNKILWEIEPSSMYIWCVTAALFGSCSGDQYTVEQDCHSLLRGVIRVMHDSAILPEPRVLHSLLAVTQVPYPCLSRVKTEIHFLLVKVREPVYMQILVLQSSGDLNRLDQLILEVPANLICHG